MAPTPALDLVFRLRASREIAAQEASGRLWNASESSRRNGRPSSYVTCGTLTGAEARPALLAVLLRHLGSWLPRIRPGEVRRRIRSLRGVDMRGRALVYFRSQGGPVVAMWTAGASIFASWRR